jgi:hypothetical protein
VVSTEHEDVSRFTEKETGMTQQSSQRALHAAQILWPAFMAAAVMEMVVFSWVDPSGMRWGTWQPDSQTIYSLSFLVFWAVIAGASLISHWMMKATPVEEGLPSQGISRPAGQARRVGARSARHPAQHPHQHHHA